MTSPENLLIGAHTSAAGGVANALYEGQSIGATTIQLFTANQKRWEGKPLSDEAIADWQKAREETGLQQIMSHDSYLINLGAPVEENLIKSRKAFRAEIERCLLLDLSFMNFHPGSYLKSDPQDCLDLMRESINMQADLVVGSNLTLLIEATAGQGTNMGYKFEELAYLIEGCKDQLPIGICIDTCHIFAAGYDIRTPEAWNDTLNEFDKIVGLQHLKALHVNDSMKEFGSRRDRHALLGEGEIGIDCFKFMMTDPRLRELPKYLETPGGTEVWPKEIKMLREFAAERITQ
jgi:deoxyribonuclease-4